MDNFCYWFYKCYDSNRCLIYVKQWLIYTSYWVKCVWLIQLNLLINIFFWMKTLLFLYVYFLIFFVFSWKENLVILLLLLKIESFVKPLQDEFHFFTNKFLIFSIIFFNAQITFIKQEPQELLLKLTLLQRDLMNPPD